jgi:hypothetical protein
MSEKGMFKTDFGGEGTVPDPEALFRDLKGRAPEIKHLWSHQADLLRAYNQHHLKSRDVAVELPTGAGKTLVGLLIAEFRRRVLGERVAYLCPTRQLAKQVGAQAVKYGIKAHVFVDKQWKYSPKEFAEYQESKAIAITTYSGVFNSNPRINDPQALILDDAHASESYIASMWSVEIVRQGNEGLYKALLGLFSAGLPAAFVADVTSDDDPSGGGRRIVELLPGKHLRQNAQAVYDLLESQLEAKKPPWYAWQLLKDHLPACNVFICRDIILIRPPLPPAMSHLPFHDAQQRVYMSATLGAGGELERITGVRHIDRLPIPPGWDKRGSGRRLFLAPQVALSDESSIEVVVEGIRDVNRGLILVPNQFEAEVFRQRLAATGRTILGASDIEDSLDPFIAAENVVLILSRYDGLDLPDDTCRLLVMGGLPGGTNLQERFLLSRIAASSLLRDRLLTRFTQGVGRCTRSDNDYAVVLLWERRLVDFILKMENRGVLHPELQAELEFGIENSKDKTPAEFKDLWRAFLEQGEGWAKAEDAIVNLRERKTRRADPVTDRLKNVVRNEVDYLYALWNRDYETAIEKARAVADALGGDETKGYRGWWYYLTGDAALALFEETKKASLLDLARDQFKRAAGCCLAISWFAGLSRLEGCGPQQDEVDELTAMAAESIRERLSDWGLVGGNFEKVISEAMADIKSSDHKAFHRGLRRLGQMLGFQADTPDVEAAPDCVWGLGDGLYIAHEAKTEQKPEGPIGVNDIRQAQSHSDWVQAKYPCGRHTRIVCVVESPRESVAKEAMPHAKTLFRANPADVQAIGEEIAAVLRAVRATASNQSTEAILEDVYQRLRAAKLRPSDVVARLAQQPVAEMPQA